MMTENKETLYAELYRKLYALFDGVTPLNADCGELCSANCCKGDNETGMLLFPHETTTLSTVTRGGRTLAVCPGRCDRAERPLACRIFPFFPALTEDGIRVIPDHRGAGICPLITHADLVRFSRPFLKNVRAAGELLAKDPECAAFLREITEEIAEEEKLFRLFTE